MKGKKNHYSLDRPRHGWEGISNGGEIYRGSPNKNTTSKKEKEKDYLELVKKSLLVSMEDTPDANDRAKKIIDYANNKYSDILGESIPHQKINGAEELKKLLDGITIDEESQEQTHRSK